MDDEREVEKQMCVDSDEETLETSVVTAKLASNSAIFSGASSNVVQKDSLPGRSRDSIK